VNERTRAGVSHALDALKVRYVILDVESDSDLHRIMQEQPRWFLDFEDGLAAVFAQASG
jgi:hypothetical protein